MKWRMTLFLLVMPLLEMCRADFYTTASGMQHLLEVETVLAKPFLEYYHSRVKKIREIEDFLDEIESTMDEIVVDVDESDIEAFVGNPVNSWVLINRMTKKWYRFQKTYSHDQHEIEVYSNVTDISTQITGFSDLMEIKGSVYAIMKVQETYLLTPKQFYKGIHRLQQNMVPIDAFDIGRYAVSLNYFKQGKDWLELALALFTEEFLKYEEKLPELFENLAWCAYQIGDLEAAYDYTQNHLDLVPTSKIANHNIWHYKRLLFDSELDPSIRKKPERHIKPWMRRNDGMCRREEKIPPHIAKNLFCRFYAPHPQFYLQPLQLEISYNDPKIYVFHNFLTERELTLIKESARHRLSIARVYSTLDGSEITANYRISKNAWLEDKVFPSFVPRIRKRVACATGLDVEYAETLQVANYGIGGNYEPHWDHATPPQNASIFGYFGTMGNRIATMLMYLTDVERGGDTVFTETGDGVMTHVTKGSAVFWYNLHRNGTGDFRTRHGGCPVLLGEKWVANFWIHEHGQEFRRPCSINRFE